MAETKVLDLRGLKCPLPVLKARKAMKSMTIGEKILLETTDPLAVIDVPAFCQEMGHNLLEQSQESDHHRFVLEVGEKAD